MRTVRKREFSSISEALSFYRRFSPSDAPPAAAAAPPASAAKEEAPPPFAGLCARKPSLRASMATRPLERFTHATAAATTTALTVFPSPCLPAPLLPLEADSPVAGLASPPAHPAGSAAPCPDDHFSRRLRFDSHASSSFVPVSQVPPRGSSPLHLTRLREAKTHPLTPSAAPPPRQVFCYRTVQIEFADPLLPGALARLVSDCTVRPRALPASSAPLARPPHLTPCRRASARAAPPPPLRVRNLRLGALPPDLRPLLSPLDAQRRGGPLGHRRHLLRGGARIMPPADCRLPPNPLDPTNTPQTPARRFQKRSAASWSSTGTSPGRSRPSRSSTS